MKACLRFLLLIERVSLGGFLCNLMVWNNKGIIVPDQAVLVLHSWSIHRDKKHILRLLEIVLVPNGLLFLHAPLHLIGMFESIINTADLDRGGYFRSWNGFYILSRSYKYLKWYFGPNDAIKRWLSSIPLWIVKLYNESVKNQHRL